MPQVGGDALIPVVGADCVELVPIVAGGVVEQHVDPAEQRACFPDRAHERVDVAQVAGDERGAIDPRGQFAPRRFVDVEKGDPGPLPREAFDALILSHPQILMLISELTEDRRRRNQALSAPAPARFPGGAGEEEPVVLV